MSALDELASTVVQLMATAATAAVTGAGDAAATLMGDLVRGRLTGAGQDSAVAAFDAAPQDPAAQAVLHTALVTVMAADQPFAVQLTTAVPAAGPAPGPAPAPPSHVASGGGVTIQGTGHKVRGNFAGRDQIINNIRNGDVRTLVVLTLVILVLALAGYGGDQVISGGDSPPTTGKSATGAAPGTELWSIAEPPWSFASPVVDDGKIYYLNYTYAAGTELLVVDAGTGTVRSRLPLDADEFGSTSELAVSNGRFYLVGGDGVLHAGDETGFLWKYRTGTTIGSPLMKAPTVVDHTVYVGGGNGIHAVDADTGTERWSFATTGGILSSPAVSKGVVYAGTDDGHLYALAAADGHQLWARPVGNRLSTSSPVVAGDTVFIGGDDGTFYAVNAADGSERWKFPTDGSDRIASAPLVSNGLVYFGSANHTLYALDESVGTKRWSVTTGDSIYGGPVLADGVVYFGSDDGKLRAVDAATGQKRWTYTTEGQIARNPAISKDTVIIATETDDAGSSRTGHLTALRRFPRP